MSATTGCALCGKIYAGGKAGTAVSGSKRYAFGGGGWGFRVFEKAFYRNVQRASRSKAEKEKIKPKKNTVAFLGAAAQFGFA